MDPSRFLREALSFVAVLGGTSVSVATVGLDIAKQFFQVHGVDASGRMVLRKKLRRSQVAAFFANLPACTVGLEACCGLSCPLAPRTESYDSNRLTHACPRPIRAVLSVPVIAVAPRQHCWRC